MIDPIHQNFAFIDNQNLYMSVKSMGWKLDYARLYSWLRNKYQVSKAFMFIGYIEENRYLYDRMEECGFQVVFRPTIQYKDQSTKGNCDTELVMQVMIELTNFNQAVVISGDGDFYSLYKHLIALNKLKRILIPNQKKYSALLRKFRPHITFLSDTGLQDKLKERH
jgi:uncharacterized LabA/DUF88 family protein